MCLNFGRMTTINILILKFYFTGENGKEYYNNLMILSNKLKH